MVAWVAFAHSSSIKKITPNLAKRAVVGKILYASCFMNDPIEATDGTNAHKVAEYLCMDSFMTKTIDAGKLFVKGKNNSASEMNLIAFPPCFSEFFHATKLLFNINFFRFNVPR
jgi:hypothetical protein